MRHQVSAAQYQRCVDEGACTQLAPGIVVYDRPAVQVSWRDAEAYGVWLSRKTGIHYRLPSDQELAIAAGTLFHDDALPVADDSNPAQRWLPKSELEASRNVPESDKASALITGFAGNENGLFNVARDVWEWTDTCFVRQALDWKGDLIGESIRVAAGSSSLVCTCSRPDHIGGVTPSRPTRHARPCNVPSGCLLARIKTFASGFRSLLSPGA